MNPLNQRQAFACYALLLALLLEVLVVLALLSGAIPLSLANPIWWLRLSDAAVGLAPVLLLALVVLHLGAVLPDSDDEPSFRCSRNSFRLARRWAVLFALLVPLQLIGYGWLWISSERQLDGRLSQVEAQRSALLNPLLASASKAELRQRLMAAPPGGFPAPPIGLLTAGAPLEAQKRQLSEATQGALNTLRANLRDERTNLLRNSLPGSLRVLLGAAILSAFLFTTAR